MVLSFISPRPVSLFDQAFAHLMAPEPLVLRWVDTDDCMADATAGHGRVRKAPTQSRARTVRSSYSSYADANGTVVNVDLPGVPKDNVTVELDGRKLTITGRRSANECAHGGDAEADVAMGGPDHVATTADAGSKATDNGTADGSPEPATVVTDENDQATNADSGASADADGNAETPGKSVHPQHNTAAALKQPTSSAHDVVYHTVLRLKPAVDVDAIAVERLQDGVLTLRLPHLKPREPRRLSVQ